MPTSKHRRKAGGKSLRHPGRGKLPRERPLSPAMLAWRTFSNAYCRLLHQQWPDDPAGDLLDIVSDVLFGPDMRTFHTANKAEMFLAFMHAPVCRFSACGTSRLADRPCHPAA